MFKRFEWFGVRRGRWNNYFCEVRSSNSSLGIIFRGSKFDLDFPSDLILQGFENLKQLGNNFCTLQTSLRIAGL